MAANDVSGDKFLHHTRAVALEIYGEPNKQLSSKNELRFGSHGSVSVDVDRGVFFDHSENAGGGVLWAIERATGRGGAQAVEWMREHGFDVEDDRPAPPPRGSGGGGNGPRLDQAGNWLPQRVPDHGRLTKTYDYTDAAGEVAYQVCRYEWTVDTSVNPKGREKTFVQRVPDPKKPGGWSYSTKGITWLPYRLPELLDDIRQGFPVYVVEGEKKADMLREIGVPATCNHGGAGKFPEDLAAHFKGAKVILLPDNDGPGRDHMALVGRRLEGIAASVMTLELPGLPPKGGVDDWLPAGGSAEALYDLMEAQARPFEAAPFVSKFQAVEWDDLDAPGPGHEYLVKNVLTEGEMSMFLGESQSGKSFLAIDIAMAVARGVNWFGNRVRQGAVIYQAGESATGIRRRRLPAYRIGHNLVDARRLPFTLLQGPLDLYSSDDPTEAFIEECLYWGRKSSVPLRLIVIDTFNKATPGANENDGRDMGVVLARGDLIRRKTGAHVMFVHHLNSGGTKARGHTSLFANVENVITIRRVEDARDAENRPIREWKLSKQKEGEDGKVERFVLRGIEIGTDADGDRVFSCTVADPQKLTGDAAPAEDGLSVSGNNAPILRAIYDAVRTRGVLAPASLDLPLGARAVARRDLWDVIRGVTSGDDDPTDIKDGESPDEAARRRNDARRQRVKRSMDFLYSKAVIGIKDDWVWLTGRKVRGFGIAPGLGHAEAEARLRHGSRGRGPMARDDDMDRRPDGEGGPDLPFDDGGHF